MSSVSQNWNELLADITLVASLTSLRFLSLELRGREEVLLTFHDAAAAERGNIPQSSADAAPASPRAHERATCPRTDVLVLYGAYSRYGLPYAWIRSDTALLSGPALVGSEDSPLPLRCTGEGWNKTPSPVLAAIFELASLLYGPSSPQAVQPLAVDYRLLEDLADPKARLYAAAALLKTLRSAYQLPSISDAQRAALFNDVQNLSRTVFEESLPLAL
jgi:hypothetical protein